MFLAVIMYFACYKSSCDVLVNGDLLVLTYLYTYHHHHHLPKQAFHRHVDTVDVPSKYSSPLSAGLAVGDRDTSRCVRFAHGHGPTATRQPVVPGRRRHAPEETRRDEPEMAPSQSQEHGHQVRTQIISLFCTGAIAMRLSLFM